MKKSKTRIKKLMTLILTGLLILFLTNCGEPEGEGSELPPISWTELLKSLDLEADITFVQNGESIQEAIDAASSGDIIYIAPGNYPEKLTINKSDITLIGFSLSPDDIKISKNSNIDILKLYNQKSIDNFIVKSQKRGKRGKISDFLRTDLGGGIAHYQFKIRMGPGEFDVISMHRVIRESSPLHPILTEGDIFMVHGAFAGFEGTFLASGLESSEINASTSAPYSLAAQNIDVWGIDMGWTVVPDDENLDFSFMKDWGYEKDANHTLRAMRIARIIRGLTGQGFSGLNLMGFSSGVTVAYAAANKETQKLKIKRHIKGLVTIDNAFKVQNGEDNGCGAAQLVADDIAAGNFANTNGQFFQTLGFLALNYPDDISPIFDDGATTNIQVFRLVLGADVFGFGFHFIGGDFGGLLYSDETRVLKAVANYSHFMPNLLWQDIDALNCSSMDVSFDDHLNLISVPILYIGAGGGVGAAGEYTSSLTNSNDVVTHEVNLATSPLDFGHVDNWIGTDAELYVWSKMEEWIVAHQ